METLKWPTCQGAHNYRVFVGELPSRKGQLGKPQSGHVSCVCQWQVCRGLWWDSAWTLSRHLWVQGLARLGFQGVCGVMDWQALPGLPQHSIAHLLQLWGLLWCARLGCTRLCSELILRLCRGIRGLLPWAYATVCLVSHLCMATTTLTLSADTVKKLLPLLLCVSSFLPSLISDL